MRYYYLKTGKYYLEDYELEENNLKNFTIGKEYKKLFFEYEDAEDIRKLIFIETGLNLEIRILKEEK